MTPKEKAIEIVDKMYQSAEWGKEEDYNPLQQYQRVKLCALICCEEVLGYMGSDRGTEFWQSVKQEIEKL